MTTNQSSMLVKNPQTKKAIAVLERFAKAEAALKALEKDSKAALDLIKKAMIANNVQRITLDSDRVQGYITLAERINYKADDISRVPAEFTKPTLDTEKIKAQHTLTNNLPNGVVESKTQFITKKIKLVEK